MLCGNGTRVWAASTSERRRLTTDQTVGSALAGKHICMVVNSDWFFLSHRLPIAKAALDLGARVTIIAGDTGRGTEIESHGLRFVPLPIDRSGLNPLAESRTLFSLVAAYRRLSPDLVHHVTLKPVVYGSIAARIAQISSVVNAVSGLGYAFAGKRKIRVLVAPLLRLAARTEQAVLIVQNETDEEYFRWLGVDRLRVIKGSGVDTELFRPSEAKLHPPIVVLAARMLWDKGIGEFVEAARALHDGGNIGARFVLVGATDDGNRAAVPTRQLREWDAQGIVEWWGHCEDMPAVMNKASIAVLPSYREGLPKSLLEGAAAGLALVTTDVPGCRDLVTDYDNGLVVPARDPGALAAAIGVLLNDPVLRRRLGRRARGRVLASGLDVRTISMETMGVYANSLRLAAQA